jgi:CheY-like chemotaxis protein
LHTAKASILCVDDENIPRMLRSLILQKQGYQVITASSAKEALELLERQSFDLVLTDQMMPGMSGIELTKLIKAKSPDLPVIIVSGVNELPAEIAYADLFISKIEGPTALFEGVAKVLQLYRGATRLAPGA